MVPGLQVDPERIGLVTQQQFIALLQNLFPHAPPACMQLFVNCADLIDPFGHQRVSFSQVVEFLTSPAFLGLQPALMGHNENVQNSSIPE